MTSGILEIISRLLMRPIQYSSVQSLSRVRLFATPRTAAHQASLSTINSQSLPKLMSIESVMPSSHLILCRPLLLPSPIPPSIRVFSNRSTLRIRWPSTGVSGLASFLLKTPMTDALCWSSREEIPHAKVRQTQVRRSVLQEGIRGQTR